MPQMGESIFEGTITKWLKKAGDVVEKDEPLFEISTDKVDAEIPAPIAGVLTEIKVPAGETVQINTVVAVIGASAVRQTAAVRQPISVRRSAAGCRNRSARVDGSCLKPRSLASSGAPLRSSPLVRRIAKENNLDLARVAAAAASGAGGRITKDDVLRYLSQNGPGSTAAAASRAPFARRRSGAASTLPRPGAFPSAGCGPSSPSAWWRAWPSPRMFTRSTRST